MVFIQDIVRGTELTIASAATSERPARGAVLYTDKFPLMAEPGLRTREILAMHRTQRAPFDEKHAHQRRP